MGYVMHAYGIVSAVTFTKDNLGIRNAFILETFKILNLKFDIQSVLQGLSCTYIAPF